MDLFLRLIFFPIAIWFVTGEVFAQHASETIRLPLKARIDESVLVSTMDNGSLYFLNLYSKGKNRYLYRYRQNEKIDSLCFDTSKRLRKLFNERIDDLVVKDDTVVVVTNDHIYQLINNKNYLKFRSVINNVQSFKGAECIGDNVLLHVCYPFHPAEKRLHNLWARYSMKTGTIEQDFVPSIDNSRFGNLVNSWVTSYKGLVAQASTWEYKVHFYNDRFQLVDSMIFEDEIVKKIPKKAIDTFLLDSKEGVGKFRTFESQNFSRIRKVYLLDSTHLLVLIKMKEADGLENKVLVELIEKKNGTWKKIHSSMEDLWYVDGQAYNDSTVVYAGMYQNFFPINVSDGRVMRLFCPYVPKVVTSSFNRKKDIGDYITNSKEYFYGLEIFDFNNFLK